MAKLNGDDRKKRRKRAKKAKEGTCPRYPSAKVKYRRRAVAEFDRSVMQAQRPDFVYRVFKCDRGTGCGRWHVGRLMENGEYVIAEPEGMDSDE